jgi:ferredoxin
MTVKSFTKDAFKQAVNKLGEANTVYGPVKKRSFSLFEKLENGSELDLESQKTKLSPKGVVFPQGERMFEYSLDENVPDHGVYKNPVDKESGPQVVVGIRPCDAYSFKLVERNFDTPQYRDPWWTANYARTTFVGLACKEPCATCFCTSVGSGPADEQGLDVIMFEDGDGYLAKSVTEKGQALLDSMGGEDADETKVAEAKAAIEGTKIPSEIKIDNMAAMNLKALFDADFWSEEASGCINCGACTFSCPTCWCFDVQEEIYKKDGVRVRTWDSCMFPLFTIHASGHNPRGEKHQRLRNRFMHKLKYYLDRFESGVLCVGCGRCIEVCPVNIDIRRISEKMNNFSE